MPHVYRLELHISLMISILQIEQSIEIILIIPEVYK